MVAAAATIAAQGKCARTKGPRAGVGKFLKREEWREEFVEEIRIWLRGRHEAIYWVLIKVDLLSY